MWPDKTYFKCFRWRSGWATQRRLPFFATYRGSRDLRGGGGGGYPPVEAKVAQTPVNARVKPAPRWPSEPPSPWWEGVFEHSHPSNSAPMRIAKKREGWWIAHKIHDETLSVFFGSSQYWGHDRSKNVAFWLNFWALASDRVESESFCRQQSLPLVTENRIMYNLTIQGQNTKMTWPHVRSRSSFNLA